MSNLKRVVAGFLALILMFSNLTTAYAQEINVPLDSNVVVDSMEESTEVEEEDSEIEEEDSEIEEEDSEIEEEDSEIEEEDSEIEEEDSEIKEEESEIEEEESEIEEEDSEIEEEESEIEEEDSEVEEDPETGEEVEVETLLGIEYLVIDTPSLSVSEEARIFIGLTDVNLDLNKLKLYAVDENGSVVSFDATTNTGDGVLFAQTMQIGGTYKLACLVYEQQVIEFVSIGIEASFGVGKVVDTNPDAVVEEEAVSTDVYLNEGDTFEEQESLESALASAQGKARLTDNELVIVLDPGHDETHVGARGYGLEEEDLTLKIALYCKAVLDNYPDATVYMTRSTGACPYPGTTSGVCNEYRVINAKNLGADVFISFHLNSSTSSTPNGAEVYYPNSNYNPEAGSEGYGLATEILNNLVALGLADRGVKIRNSENSTLYPDGSLADYYGVIRNSKLNGFPGIIIEHAFLSNLSDVNNYLSLEEQFKALGEADAEAIINFYGLRMYDSAEITTGYNANGNLIVAAEGIPNIYGLDFAIWSDANGQDDLKWYKATRINDNWFAEVDLSNHNTLGSYQIHAYIKRGNGSSYFIGATTYQTKAATAQKIAVTNVNASNGTFDVVLSGIQAEAGVATVQIPVWTQNNQSDIKWYNAVLQSDGSYKATVNSANHNYAYGKYNIHAYLTQKNGMVSYVKGTTYTLNVPTATISHTLSADETTYTVEVKNVPYGNSLNSVRFAVWSEANGQDDMKWYDGVKQSDGSWKAVISNKNHSGIGKYQVHIYAIAKNGASTMLGSKTYSLSGASGDKPVVNNPDATAGTFDVRVSNVVAKSGVSKVQIPIWTQSNQSDMYWYTATKQSDGSYVAKVNIANHKYNYGKFQMHVYVTDKNQNMSYVSGGSYTMNCPTAKVTAVLNDTETFATATITNVPYANALSAVKFAVWSDANGQDDMKWYDGAKQNDGSWKVMVTNSNHSGVGKYNVHVYAYLKDGTAKMLGSKTYTLSSATADKPVIKNVNASVGSFDVVISNVVAKSGVSKVQIPVWTKSDQSDMYWYTATKQSDGTYLARINIANHKYNYGKFQMHVYVTDKNRNMSYASGASYTMNCPSAKISTSLNANETYALLVAQKVPYGNNVANVQFAVWSNVNGQDDLKWYNGVIQPDGTWHCQVPTANHRTPGTYSAHAYVTLKDGSLHFAGSKSYKVSDITVSKVSASNVDEVNGTFIVNMNGVSAPAGLAKMRVAVWCASDQSDMVWYDATKVSNDTYKVYVDIRNHKNNLGTYNAHVYAEGVNGISKFAGVTTCKITACSSTYYNIMGSSAVTVNQMVAYYNSRAVYPAYYTNSDAPTIQAFCQMYYDECKAEGVKVEVAFCQAMKETGFLRFGGDVSIVQYNFAGIGATGNGNPGNSFASVRQGIRAQVQHLKAYASTEGLNNACVDPRFQYVTRGCAPYVEWLGKNENPIGAGWATSKNYGYSIKNDYISKMLMY